MKAVKLPSPIVCIEPRRRVLRKNRSLEDPTAAPTTVRQAEPFEVEDISKCMSEHPKDCASSPETQPPPKVRSHFRAAQQSSFGDGSSESEGVVVVKRARKRKVVQLFDEENLEGEESEPGWNGRRRKGTGIMKISALGTTNRCDGPAKRTEGGTLRRSPRATDNDVDSDSAVPKATNRARKRIINDDEEEDCQPESDGRDDKAELKEDLDDLDQSKVINTRTRERGRKSRFGEALEKLKVRRTHRSEIASKQPLPEEDYEDSDTYEEGGESSQDWDEGFVTEDEDTQVDLPAEFSLNVLDVSNSFDTLIHCYVHGVLDPTFLDQVYNSKTDAYTRAAIDAVERRIQAYEHSLVASQAWRTDFKRAMNMFPQYAEYEILAEEGCDACGKLNRTATVCVVLSGKAYDKRNFKDLEDEDDTSDFSDSEDLHEYRIGRYCHARSKLYHELQHMRYHFYERVEAEIDAIFRKLGDEIEATDVIDEMHTSGFIKMLFSQFEGLIERAERGYAELG